MSLTFPKVAGYQLQNQIGGGGFSCVYRAINYKTHSVAACKVITLDSSTTPVQRKELDKEIRVHSALKHVNVLEFINAVIVEDDGKTIWIPAVYLLMEMAAGGDLFDKIAPDVGVDDEMAHFYFNQLIEGIAYIHSKGVAHRDLKPENLLLSVAGQLKISDFGLCSVFRHKDKTRFLTERCGSLPYVAPELNSNEPYKAEPVDVWGAGVILFTLLCGNTPWDEPTSRSPEFTRFVTREILSEAPWNRITPEALSLVMGILTIEPESRMTLEQVYSHPWCHRASQLASQSQDVLALRLTQSLRDTGDLELAEPSIVNLGIQSGPDLDGDETMRSQCSQFTQTLLLFSQTQSGRRYTPHLTRFYASLAPSDLMLLTQEALRQMGVQVKAGERPDGFDGEAMWKVRIGGIDQRREQFKGWVEIERSSNMGGEFSLCVMKRDKGNPIGWRQLWKKTVESPLVEPHVLKRRR